MQRISITGAAIALALGLFTTARGGAAQAVSIPPAVYGDIIESISREWPGRRVCLDSPIRGAPDSVLTSRGAALRPACCLAGDTAFVDVRLSASSRLSATTLQLLGPEITGSNLVELVAVTGARLRLAARDYYVFDCREGRCNMVLRYSDSADIGEVVVRDPEGRPPNICPRPPSAW